MMCYNLTSLPMKVVSGGYRISSPPTKSVNPAIARIQLEPTQFIIMAEMALAGKSENPSKRERKVIPTMQEDREVQGIALFEQYQIRCTWFEERWFFPVVDVISALTDSKSPLQYWRDMKRRITDEGFTQTQAKCLPLKFPASDGKMRATDCADTETMLRIIQSIPSPKAEPFKQWLAQVGSERIEEANDPELAYQEWKQRAINSFVAQGYSPEWAANRVDSIIARKDLVHEWMVRGITEREVAILTDRLHMGMFGLSIQSHMDLKGFPITYKGKRIVHKGNLRSGMTAMELVVTTFGEGVARALHIQNDSQGIVEITEDVDVAADLARENRLLIEQRTGQPVVSRINAIPTSNSLWDQLPGPSDK